MRKNKIASMVTALVLTAAMLTGCGSASGNGNASQSAKASTSAATQTTESSAAAPVLPMQMRQTGWLL